MSENSVLDAITDDDLNDEALDRKNGGEKLSMCCACYVPSSRGGSVA
ncbi:MAG: hypothetical protein O3A96_01410 [Proteobacteria bacterium]|nr:hypothetical protein [Pseudomonadota bacterium]